MDDRQKAALLREVDRYLALGRELFPLQPERKEPLQRNWRNTNYSRRQLHSFVNRRGCNIAWRIGPTDIVIDVDPRKHSSLGSEEKLTERWGVTSLTDVCPTIHTGGKDRGRHYYTKSRGDVKLKTLLREFPDLEFRHHGQYVLIAGCIHPDTKKAYYWDPLCPQAAPTVPEWLFNFLWYESPINRPSRKDAPTVPYDRRRPESMPSTLSLHEIKGHLDKIPATHYQNYDDWLRMGMAIHAACAGDPEGVELFVEWSISDPTYFDAEPIARAKWRSFDENREQGITAATLVAAAIIEGGAPCGLPAEIAFDEPIESSPTLITVEEFKRSLLRTDRPPLAKAVVQGLTYGPTHWDKLRDDLKVIYHARLASIDRIVVEHRKQVRRAELQRKRAAKRKEKKEKSIVVADPAIEVAEYLLKEHFNNGEYLIHAKNQQFYEYKTTHWEPLPANEVDQLVLDAARTIQVEGATDAKFRASSLFATCERVLVAMTAKREDVFNFQGTPKAVINTENAEVWISPDGSHEARAHSPESYLLSCLNTRYIEGADCPVFSRTLQEIFNENKSPKSMIRHLYEFFGYTMQPFKNIPTWWMFQGDGSNGKTFVFNIFQRLLGTAVLPKPVEEFADSGRNNHALASLVGKLLIMDDDARVDAYLPESALKKLSESKLFEANPKRQHAFTFMSCATPVMLINDWPRIRDLSWGLIRKAYILPFKRVFAPEEYDLNREPYVIENELPGVLNYALEGYNRLRARGQFSEPIECVEAKEQWLRAANPLIEFCSTQLKRTNNGAFVPLTNVYQSYLVWCHNLGGVRYPAAKHRFEISLKQLGYRFGEDQDGPALIGAALKGSAEDVFGI